MNDFNDVLTVAIEKAIDRKLPEIARAVRPRMMSLKRARAYLDVSDSRIRQMLRDGTLQRAAQYGEGGSIYIEVAELDRWLDERLNKGLK